MSTGSGQSDGRNRKITLEEKEVMKLLKDKQRVEGILSLCPLDKMLDSLLRSIMIDDEKEVDRLMKDGRALEPFSMKVRLAYVLGLIPKVVKDDLVCINKIRNELAHSDRAPSFDTDPIRTLCATLSTAKGACWVNLPDAIGAYRVAILRIAKFLTREAKERTEARPTFQTGLNSLQARYEEMGDGI